MTTIYQPLKINGVISTDKAVLQNLNDICTACGAFLTFDVSQGKWAVIINKAETSVASFNDSNIVGSITISETGVRELYNSVSVEFPHREIRDDVDYVDIEIDSADRFENEIDNNLTIRSDLINDPIQAQYIGSIELKQARLSKVIKFTTDYTSLALKAGDIIDVTSSMYGFTNKLFRIIVLEETDEDVIGVQITALEYSVDVYDDTGLVATERSKQTGILLKEQNTTLRTKDDVDTGNQLTRLLAANIGAALLKKLFSRLAGTETFGPEDQAAEDIDAVLSNAKRPACETISAPDYVCEGDTITVTVGFTCSNCLFDIPDFDYDYEITGVSSSDVTIPLTGTVTVSGGTGTLSIPTTNIAGGAGSQTLSVTIGDLSESVIIYDVIDKTYSTTASAATITEGGSVIFTVDTTNVPNGTTIPYTITGTASSKVTSPALTGTITINSDTASLTVVTANDSVYTSTQSLTFTINPTSNPCSTGSLDFTAECIVLDTELPPYNCQYVQVPLIWCAEYNGDDDQCQTLEVQKYAYVPVAQAGEATVSLPSEVSVTKGNPSTVTVTNTVAAASSSNMGGVPLQIITSFNSISPAGIITGTTTTVYGYLA